MSLSLHWIVEWFAFSHPLPNSIDKSVPRLEKKAKCDAHQKLLISQGVEEEE